MDPYKILGVSPNATADEIRRAYRRKASKYHPDRGGEVWVFQQIQDAYHELTGNAGEAVAEAQKSDSPDSHQSSNAPFEFDVPKSTSATGSSFWQAVPSGKKRKAKSFFHGKQNLRKGIAIGSAILVLISLTVVLWLTFGRSNNKHVDKSGQSDNQPSPPRPDLGDSRKNDERPAGMKLPGFEREQNQAAVVGANHSAFPIGIGPIAPPQNRLEDFTNFFSKSWKAQPGKLPEESLRPIEGRKIPHVGSPTYTFDELDGASVITLSSPGRQNSRFGLICTRVVRATNGFVEARFNTLDQGEPNVDGLFELWLVNESNLNKFVRVGLYGDQLDTQRKLTTNSSSDGLTMKAFEYSANTWYRIRIFQNTGQNLTVAVYSDDGKSKLISHEFSHPLSKLGYEFNIGISQWGGNRPNRGYRLLSAVDYIESSFADSAGRKTSSSSNIFSDEYGSGRPSVRAPNVSNLNRPSNRPSIGTPRIKNSTSNRSAIGKEASNNKTARKNRPPLTIGGGGNSTRKPLSSTSASRTEKASKPKFKTGRYTVDSEPIGNHSKKTTGYFVFSDDGKVDWNGNTEGSWKATDGKLNINFPNHPGRTAPATITEDGFTGQYWDEKNKRFLFIGKFEK